MQFELKELDDLKSYGTVLARSQHKPLGGIPIQDVINQLDVDITRLSRLRALVGCVLSSDDRATTSMNVLSFLGKAVGVVTKELTDEV